MITNYIRNLTPFSRPALAKGAHSLLINATVKPQYSRSLVYLHKGSRVRGLARDETSYLVSPTGKQYGTSEDNLQHLKKYLGEEYLLPDSLLLQVLTHKSFAHGSKPFNEKLSIFGSHLLKYRASLYTISQAKASDSTLPSFDFTGLGSSSAKRIISSEVLAQFLRDINVGESVFWKKRSLLITDPKVSGEESVYAGTVEALIGALLLHLGKAKTDSFINTRLLDRTIENSLVNIAERIA